MSTDDSDHVKSAREYKLQSLSAFKDFDPESLPDNFSSAFFGQRRTGKTTILKDLMFKIRKRFDKVFIFSMTAHLYKDTDYSYVPESNFIRGLDEERLHQMSVEREAEIIKRIAAKTIDDMDRWCIILDDIIGDKHVRTCPDLNNLFVLGRHLRISVIVLSQHSTGIPPVIRRNLDFALCFFPDSQDTRETLSKEYLSLEHWRVGEQVMKLITGTEHMAIAILLKDPSARDYTDKCFKYTADVGPNGKPLNRKFVIGKNVRPQTQVFKQKPHGGLAFNFRKGAQEVSIRPEAIF